MEANTDSSEPMGDQQFYYHYTFSIMITKKGVERYYEKIQQDMGVIDLSRNKFEGKIPAFIGNLKGLRFLNVSNNILSDSIPSFLGNLILLEALDLSYNDLSREISQ
ncbi:putative leucine-rich repeat domain, L domain-containing protein [Rosa chinensis]|uniref:Putative leucine-rich repeat domain, L domain-containing protein n=1 Tax=Rosa chinensis TaxID=74649 RepID=A0A2P6PKS4_ROSCH|nr:putative leucine-rich repeat domain, L domain-containing protein [Rosa chinensis]